MSHCRKTISVSKGQSQNVCPLGPHACPRGSSEKKVQSLATDSRGRDGRGRMSIWGAAAMSKAISHPTGYIPLVGKGAFARMPQGRQRAGFAEEVIRGTDGRKSTMTRNEEKTYEKTFRVIEQAAARISKASSSWLQQRDQHLQRGAGRRRPGANHSLRWRPRSFRHVHVGDRSTQAALRIWRRPHSHHSDCVDPQAVPRPAIISGGR